MNAYTSIDMPKGGHTLEGLLSRNPEVAVRFKALEDDAAAKAAVQEGALAAHTSAQESVASARRTHANLASAYGQFKLHPESREAGELTRAAEAIERAQAIMKTRTSPALADATERSGQAAEIVASARRFLAGRKDRDDLTLRSAKVDLAEGQSFADAIAAKTEMLHRKTIRRGAISTALPPADAIKRTLRSQVEAAAARAEIELVGLYGGSQKVSFSLPTVAAENFEPNRFRPNEQPRLIDMEALACRFWGKEIIADLDARIDAEYQGEMGDEVMDAGEKRRKLMEIDKEIDRLQRELASLIWTARKAGHDVEFPTDLPAAAVLGVAA